MSDRVKWPRNPEGYEGQLDFGTKGDAIKQEKLQERGLRIICDDNDSDYSQLLERPNCKSLAECREKALITEVYKAWNGISPGI